MADIRAYADREGMVAPQVGEVAKHVALLQDTAKRLSEEIAALENKLSPVLSGATPRVDSSEKAAAPQTALAGTLAQIRSDVNQSMEQLAALRMRIEL